MKSLLLSLLAALALPTAVNAETWILVHSSGSYSRYIDASSVVKNGSWRYANLKYTSTTGGGHESGIKVDCKEQIYIYSTGQFGVPINIKYKRKSKDYWVTDRIDYASSKKGAEISEDDNKLNEGIYQFLCKEWE